jgi:hypothetical protein
MPYQKTALNSDRAVHIGNRIYKYFDNGGIAIVLNDDWALYSTIKSLPFESLRESFNLIVTSNAREGWENYFNLGSEGEIQSAKMIFAPRFVAEQTADGKYAIKNVSWVETKIGANTFKWTYSDNSVSYGINPTKTVFLTESIRLTVDNGEGKQETYSGTESILACSVDNFTITFLANNQVKFELPGYNAATSQYNIRWQFSFSASSTSNPVTKTVTASGVHSVTCQMLHKSDNSLACQFTKTFVIKCGDKKTASGSTQYTVSQCSPDQRWKLDGSIWVQDGEVGCKVKYLRRIAGVWVPAYNQGCKADLSGTYYKEVTTPTGKECQKKTAEGFNSLGEGTFPTSISHTIAETGNIFADPGNLSAGLGIKVCGVWRGWGYSSVPRLVLP